MDICRTIPVIIPSLQPDERLLSLIGRLQEAGIGRILLVDDGSGPQYADYFSRASAMGCTVLTHAVNLGKGRALKTAFNYCLTSYGEDLPGAVTADSDGQHSAEDIRRCMLALAEHPHDLVLGSRDFSAANVPFKSRWGNRITCGVMKSLCGIRLSDTQTGLRAVPRELMRALLSTSGERFEFETNMLIDAKQQGFGLYEVPIETIYEEHHSTHFHALRDSVRIYAVFLKFLASSLTGAAVDLGMFALLVPAFRAVLPELWYISAATVTARIVSAACNYLLNHRAVFRSGADHKKAALRYALLAVLQLALSAGLVTAVHGWLGGSEVLVKVLVDLVLFFISFQIQREWVFKG